MEMRKRLVSLDVLRGFDMFFITGGSVLLAGLGTLLTGNADCWLALQMKHVAWEGLRIYDLIFPLFLFITGVTFPFSTAKRLERGESRRQIFKNIVRRTLMLVILGCLYEHIQRLDWAHYRVWSVIGRIGIVWGVATTMTLFCRFRTCLITTILILVGWWLFLLFVPAPDAPVGAHPIASQAGCFATWFDTHYLTTVHRHEGGLATIAMLPTAFFGIWSGTYLMKHVGQSATYILKMVGVGTAAILFGYAWSIIPVWGNAIVKNIWTGSYALIAGGISVILLAAFHWVIDIKGWQKWAYYFNLIGVNAIAIYFASCYIPFRDIGVSFFGALATCSTITGWTLFIKGVAQCAAGFVFLWFLNRHKIYFKV